MNGSLAIGMYFLVIQIIFKKQKKLNIILGVVPAYKIIFLI